MFPVTGAVLVNNVRGKERDDKLFKLQFKIISSRHVKHESIQNIAVALQWKKLVKQSKNSRTY